VTEWIVAIDAGTTGIRSRAIAVDGQDTASAYREFTQHFPRPGWVEHDPAEIWEGVRATLIDVLGRVGPTNVAAIGITNQRETVLAWDRRSGHAYGNAIVWQDRRTADRCRDLTEQGHLELVRRRTGLVLDPYFSATKFEWLFTNRGVEVSADLAIGTIDAWIIWNLTGGQAHVTDVTNASRTMLFDIRALAWDPELCDLLGVPLAALPTVVPSSGRVGLTASDVGLPEGIPISGIAGDQQAALIGQACFEVGMAKNTYGTGSFALLNVGPDCPEPSDGLLTTVAWTFADGTTAYALEGAISATVDDNGGVYLVPAFTGLGSPWWDPYARGTVVGITRGTTRAHLARAVVEAMTYQTRDVVEAMVAASGTPLTELRVDGGASAMDAMLQLQADHLGVTVRRPTDHETTALGAAYLAGLAEGVFADLSAVAGRWQLDASFAPAGDRSALDATYATWTRAVERSRGWAT